MPVYLTEHCLPIALKMLRAKTCYDTYEAYYLGRHRLAYATAKWRRIFGRVFKNFTDNLCPAVLDAVADRLEITGFDVKGEAGKPGEALDEHEEHIKEVWDANRMDYNAGRVHLLALRDGDAYVLVWPDLETGRPVFTIQPADLMRVKYDPEVPGRIQWAVKCWKTDDKRIRVTFYYPDRIEKWVTPLGRKQETVPDRPDGFVPFDQTEGNDSGEPWPVPNPYGIVPVFHFANNATTGENGQSELRDVIPLQDALNKTLLDQLAAQEYVALPQRWAIGLEVEYDEVTGKPKPPFTPGVDQLWTTPSSEVKFGDFAQADVTQLVKLADSLRTEVARVTGTPLHYFNLISDPPSGEALKTLEARLIKKVKDRQLAFGNVWEDVVQFAHIVMGHPAEVEFETRWADPAPRSEKEHAETLLLKKQLGVPRSQLLTEMEYSQAQIEEFAEMREEEQASFGESLLSQFNRGELNGNGGEVPFAGQQGGAGGAGGQGGGSRQGGQQRGRQRQAAGAGAET